MCARSPSRRRSPSISTAFGPSFSFVYAFRPLGADETRHILARQWPQLGLTNQDGDFTDAEAIAAIIRITMGNFRLLYRLCTEIQRILQINESQTVTKEVVDLIRKFTG